MPPEPRPPGPVRVPDASAGAQGLENLGADLGNVSETLNQLQVFDDQVAAEGAINKLRGAQLDLSQGPKGFMNVQGEDAVNRPLLKEYGDQMDQARQDLADGLPSDRARKMFLRRADMVDYEFKNHLTNHIIQQKAASAEQTYRGGVAVETQNAAANYFDPAATATAAVRIEGLVNQEAERLGWTPEIKAAQLSQRLSTLHEAVIRAQVDSDPMGAKAYYDVHKDEIAGTARPEIEHVLKAAGAQQAGQAFADQVFGSGMTDAEMRAKAREQFGPGEPEKRAQALSAIDQRIREREENQRATEKEAADTAWKVFEQTHDVTKIAPSVWAAMNGKEAEALKKYAKQEASGQAVPTNWDTYTTLREMAENEPKKFQQLDLRQYYSDLAPADRHGLLSLQGSIAKNEDTVTYKHQLDVARGQLKLGNTPEDKNKWSQFVSMIDSAISDEQNAQGGKKLNQDERQKVIDRMMIQGTVPGRLFGNLFGGTGRPYYQVVGTPEAKDFTPTIPDADKAAIVARFQAKAGRAPNDDEIMATYKRWKGL